MDGAACKKPLGKKGKEESIGRGADIEEEEEEEGGRKWREGNLQEEAGIVP